MNFPIRLFELYTKSTFLFFTQKRAILIGIHWVCGNDALQGECRFAAGRQKGHRVERVAQETVLCFGDFGQGNQDD